MGNYIVIFRTGIMFSGNCESCHITGLFVIHLSFFVTLHQPEHRNSRLQFTGMLLLLMRDLYSLRHVLHVLLHAGINVRNTAFHL